MSVSKGNELLQELYERLKGVWEKKGKYKDCAFPHAEVKKIIIEINLEFEKT